jgi:hypothetical protein
MRNTFRFAWFAVLMMILATVSHAQISYPPTVIFVAADPAGACSSTLLPLEWSVASFKVWYCNGNPGMWVAISGGGGGTVTSVGLAGTANQIDVTGASPIVGMGSWTLSFPALGVTLPGTTSGTFKGNLTGNADTATNGVTAASTLGANVVPKADGARGLSNSALSDNGAAVGVAGRDLSFTGYVAAPGALTATATATPGTAKYCDPSEVCTYTVSFVTATGETQDGTESGGVTVDNVTIALTNIPVGPAGVLSKNIYRRMTGYGNLDAIVLVANIPNATTSYVDDVAGDWSSPLTVRFSNFTSGGILSGALGGARVDQLGRLRLLDSASSNGGTRIPAWLLTEKTITGTTSQNGGIETFTIAPSADASGVTYLGHAVSVNVPPTNTQDILQLVGGERNILVQGLGDLSVALGDLVSLTFYGSGTLGDVKASNSGITNYQTVTGRLYAQQADISNMAMAGIVGSTPLADALRLRIWNDTDASVSGVTGATITTANIIDANIENSSEHMTDVSTITTACGFCFGIANDDAKSVIGTSYGVKLFSPVNTGGTWTNHYGIYLEDQTVPGTTNNYNIYSLGGTSKNYFAGNVDAGSFKQGGAALASTHLSDTAGLVRGAAALTTDHKVVSVSATDGTLEEIPNQSANTVYAGPVSGSAAAPGFRAQVVADLPVALRTRTACVDLGTDNAALDLVDADIGPQGNIFKIPIAATIIEASVTSNAGTPSMPILQKNHFGGSTWAATDFTSAALAAGTAGIETCAATGAACLSGVAKDGTVTIVTAGSANIVAAGDYIQTKTGSGFASSGAKRMTICVSYTVN